jgi:hypothetical protein
MTATPPRDDDGAEEALSWDGETDASHVAGPKPDRRRAGRQRADRTPRATAPAYVAPTDDDVPAPPAATGSLLLVTYGIVAGAYALYTAGWLTSVLRSTLTLDTLLGEILYQFGEFLAISSAPLWFAAVIVLTRGRRPIVRLAWLLVGLVLLVPVPFVLGV